MCIIAKSLFSRSFNKWLLKLTCFHEKNLFPVIQIEVVLQWRPPVWTLKCPKTSSACQGWERYIQSRCPCRWSGAWRQRFHRRTDYAPVKLCLSWMPLRQTALCCNCIAACYIITLLVPFISNGRSNFTGLTLSSCVVKHQTSGTFWQCSLQNTHNAFYIFPPPFTQVFRGSHLGLRSAWLPFLKRIPQSATKQSLVIYNVCQLNVNQV